MEEIKHLLTLHNQVANSKRLIANQSTSRNCPQNASHPEISTTNYHIQNAEEFRQYSSTIPQMLNQVEHNQLLQLKNKYRFFLTKVDKLERVKAQLEEKYQRLEEIVNQSPPIRDETKSINFIMMISEETQKKLETLQTKVRKEKQNKKESMKAIQVLKQKITKQKDRFFELKRLMLKMTTQLQTEEKANKLQMADIAFKNIVNNKNNKKKQFRNIQSKETQNNQQMDDSYAVDHTAQTVQSSRISSFQLMHNKILKQQLKFHQKSSFRKQSLKRNTQHLPVLVNSTQKAQNELLLTQQNTNENRFINLQKTLEIANHLDRDPKNLTQVFPSRKNPSYQESINTNYNIKINVKDVGGEDFQEPVTSQRKSQEFRRSKKNLLQEFNRIQKIREQLMQKPKNKNKSYNSQTYTTKIPTTTLTTTLTNQALTNSALINAPPPTLANLISTPTILNPNIITSAIISRLGSSKQAKLANCWKKKQDRPENQFTSPLKQPHYLQQLKSKQFVSSVHRKNVTQFQYLNKIRRENQDNGHEWLNNKNKADRDRDTSQELYNHQDQEKDKNKDKEKDDSLLMGDDTISRINLRIEEKENFMKLSAEDVMKKVVECGDIGKILTLMEKDNMGAILKRTNRMVR